MKKDDEDDAPTYVMEDTKESLTKEEYEALISGKEPKDKDELKAEDGSKEEKTVEATNQKDKIAEVGAGSKKRKAAKVVSEDQDEPQDEQRRSSKADAQAPKKPKKKAKAIKLTFGDEE